MTTTLTTATISGNGVVHAVLAYHRHNAEVPTNLYCGQEGGRGKSRSKTLIPSTAEVACPKCRRYAGLEG